MCIGRDAIDSSRIQGRVGAAPSTHAHRPPRGACRLTMRCERPHLRIDARGLARQRRACVDAGDRKKEHADGSAGASPNSRRSPPRQSPIKRLRSSRAGSHRIDAFPRAASVRVRRVTCDDEDHDGEMAR
ncbi:hypothetical protein GBP346_B1524 [Burkholderia pseudomallei MSHR346]|nr:hypothetical protein GBP346_B1524 [Burkholderia pseudomallei MSHR346]